MRRASLVVLLGLALTGCGEQTSAQVRGTGEPAPSASTSEVPGTRPSQASPSQNSSQNSSPSPSTSVGESPSPTATTSEPEPVNTSSIPATDETVVGYRALSDGVNAFFRAAEKADTEHPDADPQNVAEVMRLIGDVLPDGVVLAEFSADGNDLMCLSGPATTYLELGGSGDSIRESLGTGDCGGATIDDAMTEADVVMDIGFELTDEGTARYKKRVVKGQNLADQIPNFGGFVDVLNEAMR